MAKFEGDQSIPAPLLNLYKATLGGIAADKIIKGRVPFHLPKMQEGGSGVKPAQIIQRERFKQAIANFANESPAERQRWYDSAPEWGSYLWYYNYYIMSDLAGNADWKDGGFGVIKSIQFVKETVEVGGNKTFVINAVDPAKTVVMMFGNSYVSDLIHHYDGVMHDNVETQVNLSPNIDPAIAEVRVTGAGGYLDIGEGSGVGKWGDVFVTDVQASYVKVKLQQLQSPDQYGYSLDIVEHKAQTVFPVVDSIAAEAVVISWAVTPSVAADISLIVIEYI